MSKGRLVLQFPGEGRLELVPRGPPGGGRNTAASRRAARRPSRGNRPPAPQLSADSCSQGSAAWGLRSRSGGARGGGGPPAASAGVRPSSCEQLSFFPRNSWPR